MSDQSSERPVREAVVLAVETSSRIGSAALALGPRLLEELRFSGPMQHSAEIFPAIDELLKRHGYAPTDLSQIHVAIGPGSFTGLRIAVTMAKIMHLAGSVQIVTVDSLDVVAANVSNVPEGPSEAPDTARLGPRYDCCPVRRQTRSVLRRHLPALRTGVSGGSHR